MFKATIQTFICYNGLKFMLFEVATPRRQSQQANAVVKGKNLSLSGSLREHLVRSFDGGVSFIMSLHSKQILCRMGFQYSFFTNWQWQGFSVEKSHHHIYFFFCFYFLKVLIKRERILVNYIINDIDVVMNDESLIL